MITLLRTTACLAWLILPTLTASYAQDWAPEVVEANLTYPWPSVGDFDADNDPDIITMDGDSLIWYENIQPGWTRHTIDPSFPNAVNGVFNVFDMDGDSDLDFTINGWANPGTLAWYENETAGEQWTRHVISGTLNEPGNRGHAFGDLDGDGDIDVVSPTWGGNQVLWFENVEGDTVWAEHEIGNINRATWCTVGDLDGDDDPDIISASWYDMRIFWYENLLPDSTWPSSPITSSLQGSAIGACVDLDGDTDLDLVTHTNLSGQVIWYENPGWDPHLVTTASEAWLGDVGDVDKDGDLDITFGGNRTIGWARNLGGGVLWEQREIDDSPDYLNPILLADIDSDTYPDIVAGRLDYPSFNGDVRWYKNPAPPVGIEEETSSGHNIPTTVALLQNYPNPFNPATTVTFDVPGSRGEAQKADLAVYDIRGRLVKVVLDSKLEAGSHTVIWNGKDEKGERVSSGTYFYVLRIGDTIVTRKMTVMK